MSDETSTPLLSVCIPVYNEEESIDVLIREIGEALPGLPGEAEVILVDDGSRDGSWNRIQEGRRGNPWLKALRFLGNQGQTAAIAAGIDAASGELIAFMDADLQNDPRDLPALIQPILDGKADVVCGWRAHRISSGAPGTSSVCSGFRAWWSQTTIVFPKFFMASASWLRSPRLRM